MGTNTDPYQPVERELKVTRQILRVLGDFNNPVGIVTKNHMVTRDIDILGDMARRNLVEVFLSVTTLDKDLARAMEPRASTPQRRLDAIRTLATAGIPVGVMTSPMIPGLNDHEMEAVLERAAQAGASGAGYVALRLPREIKDLFREWLETDHPDRARRVMSLVRQMRGGKDYDAQWGSRMKGEGPLAALMATRFKAAKVRYGLDQGWGAFDASQFRVPPKPGGQLDLFAGVPPPISGEEL
jgi:DNA repair photolyase